MPQFENTSCSELGLFYGPALIALTILTFVSKVVSLLFNTLSRFVIGFLPKSTRPLISWLQSTFK